VAHILRMNRILWSIGVGIALTVGSAHARLGWKLDETVSAYGQPIYGPNTDFTDKVGPTGNVSDWREHPAFPAPKPHPYWLRMFMNPLKGRSLKNSFRRFMR
jgi:hypothetical protein